MNRIYYAERDTTLYEKHSDRNTGRDEVLELVKIASGSRHFEGDINLGIQENTYNSRILIDFGTEINALSQSIVNEEIPLLGNTPLRTSVFLSLKSSTASDILRSYTIKAYPVSQSWEEGLGHSSDQPESNIGASWLYRSGDAKAQVAIPWTTGSVHSDGTSAGTSEPLGGGSWITGSGFEASQSFQNEIPDLRINVTDIVQKWLNGNATNNGFIIKRPYADEVDGVVRGSLKFFGRDTHTIFVPRLEVCWDDSAIGTSDNVITSNTYVPYFKNIKAEYRTSEIARFFVGVRPEFPTRSYATSSFYITKDQLPVSSSYEIIDSITNDVIIKDEKEFGNSTTKISTNLNDGSFFDLRMDSFMPERYYKIKLTCRRSYDTQTFDDFYFKVVN